MGVKTVLDLLLAAAAVSPFSLVSLVVTLECKRRGKKSWAKRAHGVTVILGLMAFALLVAPCVLDKREYMPFDGRAGAGVFCYIIVFATIIFAYFIQKKRATARY